MIATRLFFLSLGSLQVGGAQTALAHGGGQAVQHLHAAVPVDAAVGDGLAVDQLLARHQVLAPRHQMRFDHHADDAAVAAGHLRGDVGANRDLVGRILRAVGVRRVYHPPRRMMWQSSLPLVDTMAEWPPLVTDRKWCGCDAALMASTAILTLPSVPFLKPTGHDSPDASSRCTCDSVVRAPIAPQLIRSAMYCGLITSRNSVPAGRPSSLMSRSSSRAMRRPSLMRKLLSIYGSLIMPFQPTVVRGFSK